MKATSGATLSVLLVGLLANSTAEAAHMEQTGANTCVGNSRYDEAALRKRTGGLTNEGTASVIVTCSMPVVGLRIPPNDTSRVDRVRVQIYNGRSTTTTIGCRLVLTNAPTGGPSYLGNVSVPPSAYRFMEFQPERDRFGHRTFALTCTLPPQITIQKLIIDTSEFQFQPMEG